MKLPVYNLEKDKTSEQVLPIQFTEAYRPDLIRRAVQAVESAARQAYGAFSEAGKRTSSKVSKRRKHFRGCYGAGISRVNRKVLSRHGMRFFWVGAFSPQTKGGRRSHPPQAEKILVKEINKKENRKAIRTALAATVLRDVVVARGHKVPAEYPFVLETQMESLAKTKDVETMLQTLGFADELSRSSVKKVRAGIGKLRGRKYRTKKSVLFVVGGECPLLHAAINIPGVEAVVVSALNTKLLAPGALPGRVTLWTQHALQVLDEKKMFM